MSRWTKEKVCCGIIFRGPHGEVAIDPRFLNPCPAPACKILKEPLAPLTDNNNLENNSSGEVDMETDDSASVSSVGNGATRVMEEVDDEGFFDKPAVSPSESSGTSTPPPSSEDSENLQADFLRHQEFAT